MRGSPTGGAGFAPLVALRRATPADDADHADARSVRTSCLCLPRAPPRSAVHLQGRRPGPPCRTPADPDPLPPLHPLVVRLPVALPERDHPPASRPRAEGGTLARNRRRAHQGRVRDRGLPPQERRAGRQERRGQLCPAHPRGDGAGRQRQHQAEEGHTGGDWRRPATEAARAGGRDGRGARGVLRRRRGGVDWVERGIELHKLRRRGRRAGTP